MRVTIIAIGTRGAIEALSQAGQRAVVVIGGSGLSSADFPSHVFPMDEVPYDWLFPRMAAVIHHGGAGTTAAGLRASCPSVLIPYFADQPFWATRVQELGVGPPWIPRRQLSVERLGTRDPSRHIRPRHAGTRGGRGAADSSRERCCPGH